MTITWEQKAASKQTSAYAKIPPEWRLPADILQQAPDNVLDIPRQCGLLTSQELGITEDHDATALRDELSAGKLSAVDVTVAFCKRAAIAQQLTSCLTETLFPEALKRARELDEHLQTTGKPIGPLHGLPISVKESFHIRGIPTSLGFISFLDRTPVENNSVLVDILLAAGAVLYVKTNIPQTMMSGDSHNNVFGRVENPHRRGLTAGGSSGGEGTLVALRGSVLGIGTDVAGSIRIPALCCGTFGFKPSIGRVPYAGQTSSGRPGMIGIAPVAGPLCHSARDAEMLLRVVCDATASTEVLDDSMALGFPWMEPPPSPSALTIGILPEDPQVPLHPNMQRTLDTATKKLAAAGHHLVDLFGKLAPMQSLKDTADLAFRFFRLDPDQTPLKHIANGNEPITPSLRFTFDLEGKDPEPTLRDLFALNEAREKIAAMMRRVYSENRLDVILAPGFQSCAGLHDTYGLPVYTVFANLIDYPACIIPFGKANEVADGQFVRDVPYTPPYLPNKVENAPCHIQLMGYRLKDEMLMQHAKVVESILAV